MTVRITHWLPAAALALLLCGGGVVADEADGKGAKKEGSAFGALRAPTAEEAQKQAADWLKSQKKTDAASQARFKAIWEGDRPLIDKVSDTLALGSPEAAKLLAEARDADTPAPTTVPALLKDARQPTFFRANLSLAYAKALTGRKVYEEALDTFAAVKAEDVVDPAAFFFHKAVCEHALMLRDQANATIDRLLVDVIDGPERYRAVGSLMFFDMVTWQEKDLGWIARKMDNIQRRLDLKRGGKQTQKMQREVLVRLDEMIKEMENKAKSGSGDANGGADVPSGGGNGGGSGQQNTPSSPMRDSGGGAAQGSGEVDKKRVKEITENWGNLPPKERAAAIQELTRNLPAKDRAVIEEYFRRLDAKPRR
jgi:hypothetical protein